MMNDYNEIKTELKRIKTKVVTPSNSTINKKLALLREKNFELYENSLLHYNKILEDLISSEKEVIVNILLEKVSKYGENALTEGEKKTLKYYSSI